MCSPPAKRSVDETSALRQHDLVTAVLVDQASLHSTAERSDLGAEPAGCRAEVVVADVRVRDGSPRHDVLRLAATYLDMMGLA